MTDAKPNYKYLDVITGLFVAVLLISNVAATKLFDLGGMPFDGGALLFPLSYIFGDILTEVYGFRASRRVIWTGFAACGLMAATFHIVGALPPHAEWSGQAAFETILLYTPRIVAASVVAYLAGEFLNAIVLAKMKIRSQGRALWKRTIGSTLLGQAVDTALFCMIAFGGMIPAGEMAKYILAGYAFKCGVEILFTPATYVIVGFLKRTEGVDHYDVGTKFNPFRLA